jgi:hypothetical protein
MKKAIFTTIILMAVFVPGAFAQELNIDFRFNALEQDTANFLSFSGPRRYGAVNKDTVDTVTGASIQKSTSIFLRDYYQDISGGLTMPEGLKGLLLFPVSPERIRVRDGFNVSRAANGVITVQFVHSGNAYRLVTDSQGRLQLPNANSFKRALAFVQGTNPFSVSRDFSADGRVETMNWARVWDAGVRGGAEIPGAPNNRTTGDLTADLANSTMYKWSGPLQFEYDGKILKINGTLSVAR